VFVLSHGLVVAAEQPPLGREALSPPYPVSPQIDNGLEFAFGFTSIYQQNVRGGISTHRRAGRFSGSYDAEAIADLRKLLGMEGARLYIHAEGGYSRSAGINDVAVGSALGVNADAFGREAVVITELYFEQSLADETFTFRIGKMDITGGFECSGCAVAFDTNKYANHETSQFLNAAMVNNPTIPFPDYALGISAIYTPNDWWYAAGGVVDAEGDFRHTGFNTAFHGDSAYFYVFETGVLGHLASAKGPMPGGYRIGMWVDSQQKTRFSNGRDFRNDTGFYVSLDQMLYREDARDYQGLGGFCRFGWANSDLNDISRFVSFGMEYEGLIADRDEDVLAVGVAHGAFSDHPGANGGAGFSADHETAWEVYYRAQMTSWLAVSPSLQYIRNPGGLKENRDAVVIGLRLQADF